MNLFTKLLSINPRLLLVSLAISLCLCNTAHAWVYSEHRDIALQAVQNLDAEHRADFDRLWNNSRTGFEKRLCDNAADSAQGLKTDCLDWAAFSAIAGDHSCSSQEMLEYILTEDWLLEVADISAQLKSNLAAIPVEEFYKEDGLFSDSDNTIRDQIRKEGNRAKRANALHAVNIQLLRADPHYATRADANSAHFLIARPDSNTTNQEYARLALSPGSEINAMGIYVWYHISALQKASRLANEPQLTKKQRQTLILSMLADEGFALHFLEDIFAAGHVAGSWGEVSQRMGTHNYYNEHGLEAYTWNREQYPIVLMGDAHMRQQDAELVAKTISTSLRQVIDFAMGRDTGYVQPYAPFAPTEPDDFNVCTQNQFPQQRLQGTGDGRYNAPIKEAIINTPIPGLGDGLGALPRFRSEVGPFFGLSAALDARFNSGSYLDFQNENGSILGLDLYGLAGFGMDGVMDESGDGLVFASIGYRSDSAASSGFGTPIPARSGISTRIRMPFYLFPADLLWLSPLYLFNAEAYTNIAITAVNGGLIPWQQGVSTFIGRFQFVLGREIGVTFYGNNKFLAPPASAGGSLQTVDYESTLLDFPIAEFRLYRSFSSNQSSAVVFQLFTSVDIPQSSQPVVIQGVPQSLESVWSVGIRLVFDWRHY
jgi:hypothetical protein